MLVGTKNVSNKQKNFRKKIQNLHKNFQIKKCSAKDFLFAKYLQIFEKKENL